MDLTEIRNRQRETELAIGKLVGDFCKETGVSVRAIEIDMVDVSTAGYPQKRHFTVESVRLDVRV